MSVIGNVAGPQQAAQQNRRPPQAAQEKSNSVLDDGFKDVEPNTRYPKLWAPPVVPNEKEGPSIGYDLKISLVKMLAPSVDKFNEELKANAEDPIFVGVSFYKRETFIVEVEVVGSQTPNCPVGAMRTFTTADKNEFGYYGKEVKSFLCAAYGVDDPTKVDKSDVRAVAGKQQHAAGRIVHVDVKNKVGRDTNRPFLQHIFSPAAQPAEAQGAA